MTELDQESSTGPEEAVESITRLSDQADIRRVHVLAWRDLDDPEAGGSEVHAANVLRVWSEAGIEVVHRTSAVASKPVTVERDGYRVVRRSSRYRVFPDTILEELRRKLGPRDAVLEIWNGVPYFSPVWARGSGAVLIHHVHRDMWRHVLKSRAASRVGRVLESRIAPPFYRRTPIVTVSNSSKADLVEIMGFAPDQIRVVQNGIEPRFVPGPEAPEPTVLAVGRLTPTKRLDVLVQSVHAVRKDIPQLRLRIVGAGYERDRIAALANRLDPTCWVDFVGRVSDDDLVGEYQRARVVASFSQSEGWGLSISEAAACGTPAVASDVAGHCDSVEDGVTGYLVDDCEGMSRAIKRLVLDDDLRKAMGAAAVERTRSYVWSTTALGCFQAVVDGASR